MVTVLRGARRRVVVGVLAAGLALGPLGACSSGTGGGRSPVTQVPSGGSSTTSTIPSN